jgi:CheY-like chemotaxis protein
MNKSGPIIIIEDDVDDQEILSSIFKNLNYNNKVVFFEDGDLALDYLNQTDVQPFLILSDINMPRINGFELRNQVFTNQLLQTKCIPYLFFTTGADRKSVLSAYSLSIQGFLKNLPQYKSLNIQFLKLWSIGKNASHQMNLHNYKIN